jgi:hypothetical protein
LFGGGAQWTCGKKPAKYEKRQNQTLFLVQNMVYYNQEINKGAEK